MRPVNAHMDLVAANRHGQQLFLADLTSKRGARALRRPTPRPNGPGPIRPALHRQLTLIDLTRDLRAGRAGRFPDPPDPEQAAALATFVDDHAVRHGWSKISAQTVRYAVRIMLGIQDTPGAPVKVSDVHLFKSIRMPILPVLEVLGAAGMLEDDQLPPIAVWFHRHAATLPHTMRTELDVWLDVMLNGSSIAPRRRPRSARSVRKHFRPVLPLLQNWAAAGHESLREITRAELLAALPPRGNPRREVCTGLRSIFGLLKARKVIFQNPAAGLANNGYPTSPPTPIELDAVREALTSRDPARAALTALVAFHALRATQITQLQLTDVRDGHLYLDDRVIPLAEPARARLSAYLDYRSTRFPRTANAHLFVTTRTARRTRSASADWVRLITNAPVQKIRQDRILDEATATGGDVRHLCDLFGLSVSAAYRYTATIEHPELAQPPQDSH